MNRVGVSKGAYAAQNGGARAHMVCECRIFPWRQALVRVDEAHELTELGGRRRSFDHCAQSTRSGSRRLECRPCSQLEFFATMRFTPERFGSERFQSIPAAEILDFSKPRVERCYPCAIDSSSVLSARRERPVRRSKQVDERGAGRF
jgi:hypothetical protein